MSRFRSMALAILLGVGLVTAPASAEDLGAPSEEAMSEARSRFARGVQLANDAAFDQAQVEFERAYELWPSYKILYNLALAKRELGDVVGSLTAFETYLRDGGADIGESRRAEVEAQITQLRARVGAIVIETSQVGIELLVDDVSAGKSPLEKPVRVRAGRRKVTAITEAGAPLSKLVDLAGNETVTVSFEIPSAAKDVPIVAVPAHDPAEHPRASAVPSWAGWVTTGVLTTGAIVTGVIGLSASSDLHQLKESPDPPPDRLASLSSRARGFALASDVLFGAAIVAAGASVYFTLRSSASEGARRGDVSLRIRGSGASIESTF